MKLIDVSLSLIHIFGVIAKVDELVFDSVIHASHEHDNIKMKPLSFPKPMFGLAISPARRGDEGRLSDILHKLLSEDPTLELEHDTTLNETVLRGLSAQHLRSCLLYTSRGSNIRIGRL